MMKVWKFIRYLDPRSVLQTLSHSFTHTHTLTHNLSHSSTLTHTHLHSLMHIRTFLGCLCRICVRRVRRTSGHTRTGQEASHGKVRTYTRIPVRMYIHYGNINLYVYMFLPLTNLYTSPQGARGESRDLGSV